MARTAPLLRPVLLQPSAAFVVFMREAALAQGRNRIHGQPRQIDGILVADAVPQLCNIIGSNQRIYPPKREYQVKHGNHRHTVAKQLEAFLPDL